MDDLEGQIKSAMLSVRLRKEFQSGGGTSFELDVAFDVFPGITILFGPSGAGKSTLLDCIAGLARPDSGQIVADENVLFDDKRKINIPPQERRIAYVFQTLALFPHLSVEENVGYGLRKLLREEREQRTRDILQAFRVAPLHARKPAEISGGEKQRVALARSLVTRPRVLLLDEPLTGLDAELKASIVEDLRAWNAAQKIPVLYVTHSRDEVDALGERVIAMEQGRVVSAGRPQEVLDAPRKKRLAQAAGFENLLNGRVLDLREADGVMRVGLGEGACEIEVPLGYASVGDRVRIAVRAGDILLGTEQPKGLSARNVIDGKITSLVARGTLVTAQVNCGVEFSVHVTPGAVRTLGLVEGQKVWLVLKTHSCHLVAE